MRFFGPDPSAVSHTNLLDFFRLRRSVFVDDLEWSLCAPGGYEVDQYDLPFARFLLAYDRGACVGGARLAPTVSASTYMGQPSTFMIQDFLENRLPSPFTKAHMTEPLPVGAGVWELTRFVSNDVKVTKHLLWRVDAYLMDVGATDVLALTRPVSQKLLARMGLPTRQISRAVRFEDGKHYAAFSTKVGWSRAERSDGQVTIAA